MVVPNDAVRSRTHHKKCVLLSIMVLMFKADLYLSFTARNGRETRGVLRPTSKQSISQSVALFFISAFSIFLLPILVAASSIAAYSHHFGSPYAAVIHSLADYHQLIYSFYVYWSLGSLCICEYTSFIILHSLTPL